MSSTLKSETARRNGAKSRGPVTEEGKRASSRNAVKHGIHSTRVVLAHEDPALYDRLLGAYLDEWQPATPTEEALVLDLVNARWRLQRIQHLASAMIEQEMEDFEKDERRKAKCMTAETICAHGYERNAPIGTLDNFERWEARLHRTFHRALKTLRSLQAERMAAETEAEAREAAEAACNCANRNRQNEPTGVRSAVVQLVNTPREQEKLPLRTTTEPVPPSERAAATDPGIATDRDGPRPA